MSLFHVEMLTNWKLWEQAKRSSNTYLVHKHSYGNTDLKSERKSFINVECLAFINLEFYCPLKWLFHYSESAAETRIFIIIENFSACVETFKTNSPHDIMFLCDFFKKIKVYLTMNPGI